MHQKLQKLQLAHLQLLQQAVLPEIWPQHTAGAAAEAAAEADVGADADAEADRCCAAVLELRWDAC